VTALICGSIAYDNIMVFKDRFKNHILPDKVHVLSVSFLVPELRQEFGGCAGNIAYSMKLLGAAALPMGTVGKDFGRYGQWMDDNGIGRRHVSMLSDQFTAQAFITTDLDDNQITAFHPGAMNFSHMNDVGEAENVSIGMVSPDGREGMIQHAMQFAEADIPFIFDPGQGLPLFDGDDLTRFIEQSTYVTVNDYEWELLRAKTGLSVELMTERVDALIITLGAGGSVIHTRGRSFEIPVARPTETVDPTGCGDAYRAGLLYGLMHGMDWSTTGRIASLMGAIAIECAGTQNHSFELDAFRARFRQTFGYAF
jgi:adenosine kinase